MDSPPEPTIQKSGQLQAAGLLVEQVSPSAATNIDGGLRKSNGKLQGGGRLSIWVHKLEKINTNLDDSRRGLQDGASRQATYQNSATNVADEGEELCFKISSLITELVLILFAACLLLIASLVILSKKVPSFMESYEIVPMVLFVLCIALAAFSFVRWMTAKGLNLFQRHKLQQSIRCSLEPTSAIDSRTQAHPNSDQYLVNSSRSDNSNTKNTRFIIVDSLTTSSNLKNDNLAYQESNQKIHPQSHLIAA